MLTGLDLLLLPSPRPPLLQAAEVHKTATLLGLQSCRSHPSTTLLRQRVVLQNPDVRPEGSGGSERQQQQHTLAHIVQRSVPPAANLKLVEVNGNRNLARLIAQSAVQPGVSTILGQIAQSAPGAPDFRLVEVRAACAGSGGGSSTGSSGNNGAEGSISYQEARRKLANAVVCGYVSHSDRETHLNPPDTQLLSSYDKLVVLSHTSLPQLAPGGSTTLGMDVAALQQQVEAAVLPAPMPKSIVVVGWSGPLADLMVSLAALPLHLQLLLGGMGSMGSQCVCQADMCEHQSARFFLHAWPRYAALCPPEPALPRSPSPPIISTCRLGCATLLPPGPR